MTYRYITAGRYTLHACYKVIHAH